MTFDLKSHITRGLAVVIAIVFAASAAAFAQSGTSGGGFVNPLPQTPPSPEYVIRESFGWGQQGLRPFGNNPQLRDTLQNGGLADMWAEYPGTKNVRWIASTTTPSWHVCGTPADPYELPSPIQIVNGVFRNGCGAYDITDGGALPTALVPLPGGLGDEFEVGLDGFVLDGPDSYLALGLTNSNSTAGNFFAFGSAVLVIRNQVAGANAPLAFELRAGNLAGTVLAHGVVASEGLTNRLRIRFNPRAKTLGMQLNDIVVPSASVPFSTPKYAGFEGLGMVDNFFVRKLQ